jgi:hypothetical protein
LHHPAAALLTEYATLWCPTQTEQLWTETQMQASIDKGPHASAFLPEAVEQFHLKVEEKIKAGHYQMECNQA